MNSITAPVAASLHARYLELQSRIEDKRVSLAARDEEGASTTEYVVATIAALTLASILVVLFRTGFVPKMIESFIKTMLEKFLKV